MTFVIDRLSKSFGEHKVLDGAQFRLESGLIYGLLGRNGAGKTTLFNCISGDMRADSGNCYWDDGAQRPLASDEIGYVPSTPAVPEFLTGREFLKFLIDIHPERMGSALSVDDYFDMVGIAPASRDDLLKNYSHGMKNKVQMMVNLMFKPRLLLLDEPLTSLDVVASEEMKALLRAHKSEAVTIISTHILDLALDMCDRIVLLSHGMLEPVDKSDLDDEAFKHKIIDALREAEDAQNA